MWVFFTGCQNILCLWFCVLQWNSRNHNTLCRVIQVTGLHMVYGLQTVDHYAFCPQTLHFQNFCLKITPNSLYMSFFPKKNFFSNFVKMARFYRVANIIGHFSGVFDFVYVHIITHTPKIIEKLSSNKLCVIFLS